MGTVKLAQGRYACILVISVSGLGFYACLTLPHHPHIPSPTGQYQIREGKKLFI
jgi:hypothetical protein